MGTCKDSVLCETCFAVMFVDVQRNYVFSLEKWTGYARIGDYGD